MRSVLLFSIASCARPLAPAEWRDTAPAAVCEARIADTDGMGTATLVQRYDAAGRLIYGTTRLSYDAHGREYLTWDGPRLVRADSYNDQAFRPGACEVEGGCDEPATRTVDHMRLSYDGDRLSSWHRTTLEFERETHGVYILSERLSYGDSIDYVGDRVVHFHGDIRWDNHHPLERRATSYRDTFEWSDDQLVAYRSPPFVHTFAYDDRGRLAHETLTSPQDNDTSDWRYDDAGRLVSRISRGNEWTWTYDDAGRVIRATNGGATKVYTYSGHCAAKLNVPALPTALARAHLVPCAQTAGDLYDTCE